MTGCKYIDEYIDGVKSGQIVAGQDLIAGMGLVDKKLNNDDVFIDIEKIEKAIELIERYFDMKLLDWELFLLAIIHCYYKSTDALVFDEFLIMMGRGNGKNGFISALAWYLTLPYHGIDEYNVDIVANSEDQAETSFNDVYEMLDRTWAKSKKFFYRSKVLIKNKLTRSYIKYNTSNARTKDGKRTACLIFDEIHEYENYDMISVFSSGFGKKKHSRIFYITTNGHVREGVIDDKLRLAKDVLNGTISDISLLPLLYRVDNKKDVDDPKNWHMANPSLKYFPELLKQMEKEFKTMKYEPHIEQDFYTKRMNLPSSNKTKAVTDWENIAATNKALPDLSGKPCVCGIDMASLNDMVGVNLHFRDGETRYDINHAWLCKNSRDYKRIVAEKERWAAAGHLTIVDDIEIAPELIADWIYNKSQEYRIELVLMDNYRARIMQDALRNVGFDKDDRKNLRIIRPSDIHIIIPIIESHFANKRFVWGDNPVLRWATNNTCVLSQKKKTGVSTGNFYYGKIEEKSRKTDPFMALVASVVGEEVLGDGQPMQIPDMTVYSY